MISILQLQTEYSLPQVRFIFEKYCVSNFLWRSQHLYTQDWIFRSSWTKWNSRRYTSCQVITLRATFHLQLPESGCNPSIHHPLALNISIKCHLNTVVVLMTLHSWEVCVIKWWDMAINSSVKICFKSILKKIKFYMEMNALKSVFGPTCESLSFITQEHVSLKFISSIKWALLLWCTTRPQASRIYWVWSRKNAWF